MPSDLLNGDLLIGGPPAASERPWQAMQLPSGRWFVIRNRIGRDAGEREFFKHGASAAAFGSEAEARARAASLNGALAGPAAGARRTAPEL
jgi:hypothetical protein